MNGRRFFRTADSQWHRIQLNGQMRAQCMNLGVRQWSRRLPAREGLVLCKECFPHLSPNAAR